MNYTQVNAQLLNLPDTFQRFGPVFAGLMSAITAALTRSTYSIDQIAANININTARFGWLDAIGELFGILRNPYESDTKYRARLIGTLSATRGTPTSIVNFLKLALNLTATVTENFSTTSYQVNFLQPQTLITLQQVVQALVWVRPAGVPFLPLYQLSGGLFLNTCNYLGVKQVTGSYLSNPNVAVNIVIAANTNNPAPLLPTVYLSDPYITGTASVSLPL